MRDFGAVLRANSRDLSIALALLLLVLGVYAPVRHFEFVNYDDPGYVFQNAHVTSGLSADGLRWAFTTTERANWFPLTWISLMADCQFFGLSAGPQHLTNVIFHAASTLLLFGLLKRMTGASGPSALVAFLFALHPQHVESVAWVAERKDVLSAMFWMLTLWSYVRYVSRPKPAAYLVTLLFFCLGFLSKPMVVTLPLVLVLLDVWPLQRVPLAPAEAGVRAQVVRTLVWEKLPFFVLAMVMSVTTYAVQNQGGAVRPLEFIPLGARLENALISGAVYIGKTVWPTRLAVFYPIPAEQPAWQVIAAGLVLAGLTVLALRFSRTRPYLAVGWFWYLITILPVIGIIQVGEQARADRYTYIPTIGLSLMLAWSGADAWRRWPKARPALTCLCGAACVALVALTWRQVSYWENSATLFQHANKVTDNNAIAHGCLGDAWNAQGRYDEALSEYQTALAINPRYLATLINYGTLLMRLGRTGEARAPLVEAVGFTPEDPQARNALGNVLALQGHLNAAQEQFEVAILLQPDNVAAHISLGNTLGNLGRMDAAIAEFSEALRIQPGSVEARQKLQQALSIRDRVGNK
ncbi:MAG: tetratricopeptide repeat protein [Bryobacteraceae bacterium]